MIAKLFKASGLMIAADAFLLFVSGFLLAPLYTHHMSTAEYGVVVTGQAIVAIFTTVLSLSLGSAYMRYYYELGQDQRKRFGGTLLLLLAGVIGAAWILAWTAGTRLWPHIFAKVPVAALYWTLGIAAIAALRTIIDTALRLESRFAALAIAAVVQSLLLIALAYALVKNLNLGFLGWAGAMLGASAAVSAVLLFVVRPYIRIAWLGDEMRRSVCFAWPITISMLGWFAINRSDILLLQHYRPLDETAVYGLTYAFGMLLMAVCAAIDKVMGPAFYRDIAEAGGPRRWARIVTISGAILILVAVTICLFAPAAFKLMFPADYAAGLDFLPIVVWAFVLKGFDAFFFRAILYREKTLYPLALQIGTGLLNVVLNLWLVPRFGMYACAYTTFGTFALNTAIGLCMAQKLMALPYEWRRLAWLLGTGAIICAAAYFCPLPPLSAAWWILAAAMLAIQLGIAMWQTNMPISRVARFLLRCWRGLMQKPAAVPAQQQSA